jgi:predicted RNA-binding Zn-ribbon protein involved in translation (DUF1610 family)
MALTDSMARQQHCPKCHAPLPEETRSDGICPKCGVVFAKYRAAQARSRDHQEAPIHGHASRWELLLSVPDSVSRLRFYTDVSGWLLFLLWGWQLAALDYRSGEINQSFLHGPLLVFHEAGHVIFRLFGHFMTVVGGTLGQLLMPLVLLVALLRTNRDPLGASLALWLLGVSLLDVAPYVYDALQPRMILLNGASGEAGGHDWIYILSELGLLQRAHLLGSLIYWLGVMTLGLAALWSALLLMRQKDNLIGHK